MTTQERIDAVRKAFPEVKRLCDACRTTTDAVTKAILGERFQEHGLNIFTAKELLEFDATNHPAIKAEEKAKTEFSEYILSLNNCIATAMLTILYIGIQENTPPTNSTPECFFESFEQNLNVQIFLSAKSTLITEQSRLAHCLQQGLKLLNT